MGKLKGLARRTVRSANIIGTTLPIKNQFVEDESQGIAIYVQPPSRRMVQIASSGSDEYGEYAEYDDPKNHIYNGNFFLSFPYVVFRLCYFTSLKGGFRHRNYVYMPGNLRVAFASQAKPSKLFVPPLFNLHANLQVCLTLPNKYFDTLEECMQATVAAFWATKFEDSMYDAYGKNYERKSLMGDPRKWQKKTKNQPEWIPNGRSMELFGVRMGKFSSVSHIRQGENDEDAFGEYDY